MMFLRQLSDATVVRGRFTIEFRYIDEEPAASQPVSFGDVEIHEGKHSGKLLSLSFPIDKPPLNKVSMISLRTKLLDALHNRRQQLKDADVLNQDVAEEILDEKDFEELAGGLAAAT